MTKDEIKAIFIEARLSEFTDDQTLTRIQKAAAVFLSNPSYAQEIDQCPNALLKAHTLLIYATSLKNSNRLEKALRKLKNAFTNCEWQYLIDHTPNITAKIQYSKHLK